MPVPDHAPLSVSSCNALMPCRVAIPYPHAGGRVLLEARWRWPGQVPCSFRPAHVQKSLILQFAIQFRTTCRDWHRWDLAFCRVRHVAIASSPQCAALQGAVRSRGARPRAVRKTPLTAQLRLPARKRQAKTAMDNSIALKAKVNSLEIQVCRLQLAREHCRDFLLQAVCNKTFTVLSNFVVFMEVSRV